MTASPLSARAAVAAYAQRDNLRVVDDGVYWLESDPDSGQTRLMCWREGEARQLTPDDLSVRSQVNGYGGGAFCVLDDTVYLVNGGDQQIHALDSRSGALRSLTNLPDSRHGGLVADPVRGRVLAVREHLDNGYGVGQTLVSIDVGNGQAITLAGRERGPDNLGCPVLSADATAMAWVEWRLPAMPWEQTRLRRAVLDTDGAILATEDCSMAIPAAIQQPCFVDQALYALSDHAGWWQAYRIDDFGRWISLSLDNVDGANAPWQLDERHYAWLGNNRWVRVCFEQGLPGLVIVDEHGRRVRRLAEHYTDFRAVQGAGGRVHVIARSVDALDSVLRIDPESGAIEILAGGEHTAACQAMVPPEPFSFRARDDQSVFGFLYRPAGGPGRPPVVMRVHGGPTSAAYPVFDPQVAFWTSHGFAVADVNYRGSSGYGRAFRMSLQGQWGKADVEDIGDAVAHLDRQQAIDGRRAFVTGRSAGGFTVLNALVHTDTFLAGASLFGVSDPESLRDMTHRFESGYLDWLLGDPQVSLTTWQQRTPLFWADRIRSPVIFFQGEQDTVVVPEQTDTMAHVLRRCGVPVEVVRFTDEGHGFRRAENQAQVLDRTLAFFRGRLDANEVDP
ncbi:S9 family peptidase [Marinobacter halodurans]|uniref:S9 family peptidase n=1 Tax=Marinobacter halodurans TaxID=2528979 RepID=A0ABY1ZHC6_9GAMM|nr:prolyl oligopeptidase family serine peptidase [Marinobacter halodurans]TBW52542.1 S9 family peptidase [Marinobacter halodurans]